MRLAAWFTWAAALCAVASAQPAIRVIDVGVGYRPQPVIAFDADDQPWIAYRDGASSVLQLASGVRSDLTHALCAPVGDVIAPALAVDTLGLLHAVHLNDNDTWRRGPCYTLDGGDLFGLQTASVVETPDAYGLVMALDSVDRPYVAFVDPQAGAVTVAQFDIKAGAWIAETLAGPAVIDNSEMRPVALTVDQQDRPVVAYLTADGRVCVQTRSDAGWSTRCFQLAEPILPIDGVSVAVDPWNVPVVLCTAAGRLRQLRFEPLFVTEDQLGLSRAAFITPHALAVDAGGFSHITYVLASDPPRLCAADNKLGWQTTLVQEGDVERATEASIALDSSGAWAIAYWDCGRDWLKVAGPNIEPRLPGDLNCDGAINAFDIDPFVAALISPESYAVAYPDCDHTQADANGDGAVNAFDIDPFVQLLVGG